MSSAYPMADTSTYPKAVAMGTRLTCCPYRRRNSCGHGSGRSAYLLMVGSQARCRILSMPSIKAHGFPPSSESATMTKGASTLPFTQSKTPPSGCAIASHAAAPPIGRMPVPGPPRRRTALPPLPTGGAGDSPPHSGGRNSARSGASSCSQQPNLPHFPHAARQQANTSWGGDMSWSPRSTPSSGPCGRARTARRPHWITVRRAPSTPVTRMSGRTHPPLASPRA